MSAKPEKEERGHRLLRDILETVALTLLLLLVVRLTVQHYYIDGPSMEPTLHNQEYILVDRLAYLFHPPQRGDIIVFHYPRDPSVDYVKRIIAVPGDTITVIGQTVIVDGVTLHEPYTNPNDPASLAVYPPIRNLVIGPDQYFVMGDNRGDSSDSRQWGTVPKQDIVGKATLVYWPLGANNFGLLPDESSVFAGIK
ncbi:signal peptidase I [Thermogemmatispora tikiterensis]|uniref:Signal peptidase I n=1 Tax=Thermogemmatispora tikiterensis TaxID=1825093 RepID=A0A328VQ25_9CHLR|nr:signal peptidase I [Thermogemmatispora tikiterensis]RAQ97334.1 signal peptidase I [Thermogemmatispora tikiterensis]